MADVNAGYPWLRQCPWPAIEFDKQGVVYCITQFRLLSFPADFFGKFVNTVINTVLKNLIK